MPISACFGLVNLGPGGSGLRAAGPRDGLAARVDPLVALTATAMGGGFSFSGGFAFGCGHACTWRETFSIIQQTSADGRMSERITYNAHLGCIGVHICLPHLYIYKYYTSSWG